jgi:DNA-binding XRE family transcriptional regulator
MPPLTPAACVQARRQLGWSEQDLADISGVTWRTIMNFESGRHSPRHQTAVSLIRAFRRMGVELNGSAA